LLVNPVAYQLLKVYLPQLAFLNRMAICPGIVFIVMAIITLIKPAAHPGKIQAEKTVDLTPSKGALISGIIVVAAILALYAYFW